MKKLLLILTSVMLLAASCSSDDNNEPANSVTYDEVKGYLTNLESAKHGLIGEWREYWGGGASCEMKFDGTKVLITINWGDGSPIETGTLPYSVSMEDGKFYQTLTYEDGGKIKQEITKLNKTTFILENIETYIRQ